MYSISRYTVFYNTKYRELQYVTMCSMPPCAVYPDVEYTLLKIFKGSDFQSHIFGNILGKSFQILVESFCLIMQLWQKIISKTIFYITQRGIAPKTQVYQSHCDHDL